MGWGGVARDYREHDSPSSCPSLYIPIKMKCLLQRHIVSGNTDRGLNHCWEPRQRRKRDSPSSCPSLFAYLSRFFSYPHFQITCPLLLLTLQTELKIKKEETFPYLFLRHPAFLPLCLWFFGIDKNSYRLPS